MQYTPNAAGKRPFQASHYKVKTYADCPRKYYFEYIDPEITANKRQIKKPKPELEVGNAVHVALMHYFREPQNLRNFALLKEVLKRVWKPPRGDVYGFTSLEEERTWYFDALGMLKNFYEHQTDPEHLFYVPDPFSREEMIKIPIHDDLTLVGKVDRIDEDGEGLHIIDYKTGRSQQDDDFQVMTYVILAKQKFGRDIKKASYFYLRTGFWKTYTPTPGDEKVTLEKIKRLVDNIKADSLYAPRPSKFCRYCDYIDYCPAKKEVMEILGMTEDNKSKEDESSGLPF